MKRPFRITATVLAICVFFSYIFYTFPRKTDLYYDGIKYGINDIEKKQEEIKIKITGFYYNRLFARDYFKGSISIDNENYPNLKLISGEQLQMIYYRDFQKGGELYSYGEIFFGKKLKDLTICVIDNKHKWNSTEGTMVSAPAKNRDEALEISNRLMEDFLPSKFE